MRPIPESYTLGVAPFARAADAFGAALKLGDALPLVHLEVLSPALAAGFGHPGAFVLMVAIAGNAFELEYQREHFGDCLGAFDGVAFSEGARAVETYEQLRDLICARGARRPTRDGCRLNSAAASKACGAEFRAHAGCGVAQIFIGGNIGPADARETLARWRSRRTPRMVICGCSRSTPALRPELPFFRRPPGRRAQR